MNLRTGIAARCNDLIFRAKMARNVGNYQDIGPTQNGMTIKFRDGAEFRYRDVDSAKYILDEIFVLGEYDVPEMKDATICVDVGANIGLFSKRVLTKARNLERIYCFEADPTNYSILKENLKYSEKASIYNGAAGARDGAATFYSSHNAGWSSLYATLGAEGGQEVTVPMVKLSNYLSGAGISRIDLMKVDIEGGEYEVLLGDDGMRDLDIGCLLVEIDREPRSGIRYSFDDVIGFLRSKFRLVDERRGGKYPLFYCRK